MAVRSLLTLTRNVFSDATSKLRVVSGPVLNCGEEFQNVVQDLEDTLRSQPIAVGLAAPQIAEFIRVAVIYADAALRDSILVLANPTVTSASEGSSAGKESCMSLPHYRGPVRRARRVTVTFQDRTGNRQELSATGFLARTLLHEIDHLNGILYVDRMTNLDLLESVEFFRDNSSK